MAWNTPSDMVERQMLPMQQKSTEIWSGMAGGLATSRDARTPG